METPEIEQVLQDSKFFRALDAHVIEEVSTLGRMRSFKGGEFIFQQGDFGEHIYIIAEGHVILERSTDLGTRKGRVVIDLLGKGRFLGCWSTLLGEPHVLMSSAACRKPTTVVCIKGSDLREIMVGDPKLGFCIIERLCFLLRDRIKAAYGAMEKI
jgi:CRP-like cAMP-binding protein